MIGGGKDTDYGHGKFMGVPIRRTHPARGTSEVCLELEDGRHIVVDTFDSRIQATRRSNPSHPMRVER
jgi:hypothetical protein